MIKITLILFVFSLSLSAQTTRDNDIEHVKSCLQKFSKHPFNETKPVFDTFLPKVKVLGIGGTTSDSLATAQPNLVLIKPTVTVLSKTELNLLNPNGWYCLKGLVSVLGKSIINLHCNAKLATSEDGVTILGGNESEKGVTVLGSTIINKVGCAKNSAPK